MDRRTSQRSKGNWLQLIKVKRMKIKIQTTSGIKKVNAEFAFEMYGHQFVTHQAMTHSRWGNFENFTCTHLLTGRNVVEDLDKEKVIELSKQTLINNGEKLFLKQVGKYPLINAPRKLKTTS